MARWSYPAGVGAGSSSSCSSDLDLEQQQAQIEEHVDDLGAGHEIAATEALERLVDHLGELLSARLTVTTSSLPDTNLLSRSFRSRVAYS